MLTAIKTTGTAQANHMVLDESLRTDAPSRVSVIVLFDEDAPNGGSKKSVVKPEARRD